MAFAGFLAAEPPLTLMAFVAASRSARHDIAKGYIVDIC